MKWILICVDGTDSRNWKKMDGSNSHVHTFYQKFGVVVDGSNLAKGYWHGPDNTVTGSDSSDRGEGALAFIDRNIDTFFPPIPHVPKPTYPDGMLNTVIMRAHQKYAEYEEKSKIRYSKISSHDNLRIVLIGHSRGGGIVVDTAASLASRNIQVYFVGLFDGVDMSMWITGGSLKNTKYAYHALRGIPYSRSSFGNTGIGGTVTKAFNTSHGGVGGSPEPHPDSLTADYSCSIDELTGFPAPPAFKTKAVKEFLNQRWKTCLAESKNAYNWMVKNAKYRGLPI